MRYHFIEAIVYTLLDTQHVVALHAACVVRNGRGVLLIGDSGAGKSSLAFACTLRGWTYVSDDASCLVRRRPGRTVLGNPQSFRFRPETLSMFPPLRGAIKLHNGKPTVEIRTDDLAHITTAHDSEVQYIVFLNRLAQDPDAPCLVKLSREEAFVRLVQTPWPSELDIHEERTEAIERLLGAQAYQLTYKPFDPAIHLLEQLCGG